MTSDAELNRKFPFVIDLKKILPGLLRSRMKAEKPDIQFAQYSYISKPSQGTAWQ